MGVAAIVLNILGTVNTSTSITLLGIGLFALALDALDRGKSRSLMITNPMCKFLLHLSLMSFFSPAESAGLCDPGHHDAVARDKRGTG